MKKIQRRPPPPSHTLHIDQVLLLLLFKVAKLQSCKASIHWKNMIFNHIDQLQFSGFGFCPNPIEFLSNWIFPFLSNDNLVFSQLKHHYHHHPYHQLHYWTKAYTRTKKERKKKNLMIYPLGIIIIIFDDDHNFHGYEIPYIKGKDNFTKSPPSL